MNRALRHRIRIGLLVGAVAVVLASTGVAWRRHVVNVRWQAALDALHVLEARVAASVDTRPALWGETTDEHAQPHYDRALSLVAGWDAGAVWTARLAEDEQARDARAAFVSEGAAVLEALHRGAHAADATRSVDWSRGFEVPMRKLLHVRFLTQLCEMKAATLFADGRDLEAVGVVLDALQLAGDLSHGPLLIEEMIGLASLSPDLVLDGVADGTLLALSGEARERLVTGVTALDRRLGWQMTSLEPELVLVARGLEQVLQDTGEIGAQLELTRNRSFATEHLDVLRSLCEDYDCAFRAGPRALFGEIERFPDEALQENPVSAMALPRLDSAYRSRLFSLGRFRLLAHAISAAEQPRDPWLAEFMRAEETEEGTRLWLDHEAFGKLEIHVAR